MEIPFSHGKQSGFTKSEQKEMQEALDKAAEQGKITPAERKEIEEIVSGEPYEPLRTPDLQRFGLPFKPGKYSKN